ncbi:piggyBac transposable element-derived protein 4-like [Diachasma alloeum]|uniref:piggyBac transposable element-derived protein 4-like n=1 Tax=Diachasma alloeum TaxID=454923 RepID=UPI00073834AF|nr:piggyBac transposable element-derived protein 4-like [Diachasma alloeum]
MTFHRFYRIGKYLHLADKDTPTSHPLYKNQAALDISKKIPDYFQPDRDLSVDEAMMAFYGRLGIKQYMPAKPIKWRIKVWATAEAESGYMLRLRVYLGKKEPKQNELLLEEEVVMDMTEPFGGDKVEGDLWNVLSNFQSIVTLGRTVINFAEDMLLN